MRPQIKVGDLLYYSASGPYGRETFIFSFPKGELVGSFKGDGALCPDNAGNVWLAAYPNRYVSQELAEFAHGGETPIRTLDVPSVPQACAVDPVTGNIAVVSGKGQVYIYGSTSSAPQTFTVKFGTGSCTYDGSGNLFIFGDRPKGYGAIETVAELPKGGKKFERRWGYRNDTGNYSSIQWDGAYITIGTGVFAIPFVYRFTVRGKHLKPRGSVGFRRGIGYLGSYWISGSRIVATSDGEGGSAPMYLYSYPSGKLIKKIGRRDIPYGYGGNVSVTVSLAP